MSRKITSFHGKMEFSWGKKNAPVGKNKSNKYAQKIGKIKIYRLSRRHVTIVLMILTWLCVFYFEKK